jgi:hypothetical protein
VNRSLIKLNLMRRSQFNFRSDKLPPILAAEAVAI